MNLPLVLCAIKTGILSLAQLVHHSMCRMPHWLTKKNPSLVTGLSFLLSARNAKLGAQLVSGPGIDLDGRHAAEGNSKLRQRPGHPYMFVRVAVSVVCWISLGTSTSLPKVLPLVGNRIVPGPYLVSKKFTKFFRFPVTSHL